MKHFVQQVLKSCTAFLFLGCLSATLSMAGSVTVTHSETVDGGVDITVSGSFASCTTGCPTNCTTNDSGSVALYPNLCSAGGHGSASCTYTTNRWHGTRTYTGIVYDCAEGSPVTTEHEITFDQTPTVSVIGPSGTVSAPFDITGMAVFQPTKSFTKGTIIPLLNGNIISSSTKSCTTLNCNYSYQEIVGKLIDLNHGGPYKIKLRASGGGATKESEEVSIFVNKTPTVSIGSPSGTVSGPFDITGTAVFKPTLSPTKGSITLLVNGIGITSKSCATETCNFSYQESAGKLYDLSHGGPYTITLRASGGGAPAVDAESEIQVDKTPTVSVSRPIGRVTSPSDVIGTAVFKPTLSVTKGSISAYINNGFIGSLTCQTESCTFTKEDYNLPLGGPHKIKFTATGGGASASSEATFYTNEIRQKDFSRDCKSGVNASPATK